MDATSSTVSLDFQSLVINRETKTLSVYKCLFCNKLLYGNSKILKCLHIICDFCMEKEKTDSGLQCKCCTITKGIFLNYPIVSPDIMTRECENYCGATVKSSCGFCKKCYCMTCSEIHFRVNTDHNPELLMVYPMVKKPNICSSCKVKNVEVHCDKCSEIYCFLCHISLHKEHGFTPFDKLSTAIITDLCIELNKLKKNDSYLNYCLKQTEKQIEDLEIKYNEVHERFSTDVSRLHCGGNELDLKIKNAHPNWIIISEITGYIVKLNEKQKLLNDLKKKNIYYSCLTQAILEHHKMYDDVMLSKSVLKKIFNKPFNATFIPNEVSGFQNNLHSLGDETTEYCVLATRYLGIISSVSPSFQSDILNKLHDDENLNTVNDKKNVKKSLQVTTSNTSSFSSMVLDISQCPFCNERTKTVIKCNFCNTHFHNDCHIPTLPENVDVYRCTLCQDMNEYSKIVCQNDKTDIIPIDIAERKLMERILLELYRQKNIIKLIGDFPTQEIKSELETVPNSVSLNDIKNRLPYTSLIDFLKNVKKVFPYKIFNHNSSGSYCYCCSAVYLQHHLTAMITKWIPNLDQTLLSE